MSFLGKFILFSQSETLKNYGDSRIPWFSHYSNYEVNIFLLIGELFVKLKLVLSQALFSRSLVEITLGPGVTFIELFCLSLS